MGQAAAVVIPEKIYFKIGEVCDLVGVQAHVLRYWETEFPMLSPQKNRSGQRSYRRRDVEVALRIKELLYDEMFTIAGAKKRLQSEIRGSANLKIVHPEPPSRESVAEDAEPGLFDESLEIDIVAEPSVAANVAAIPENAAILTEEKQEALKSLISHVLELREMLKRTDLR